MKIVNAAAWNLAKRHTQIDFDDLVQEGLQAAMDMMPRYDPQRAKLPTFLGPRVSGAMRDYLRNTDYVPRLARQQAKEITVARETFRVRENREPTDVELAAELSIDPSRLDEIRASSVIRDKLSIEFIYEKSADKPNELGDSLADRADQTPMRRLQSLDMLRLMTRGMTKRERLIIIGYYFEGDTMREVGRQFGVSESCISQTHTKMMERLRIALGPRRDELLQLAATN